MAKKTKTEVMKANRPIAFLSQDIYQGEVFYDGCVITPNGIVRVSASHAKNGRIVLDLVHDGKLYRSEGKGPFTARGLVTRTGRFAKEIAEGGNDA